MKASFPIDSKDDEASNFTVVKNSQFMNAPLPIEVTDDGMNISLKYLKGLNMLSLIDVKEEGTSIANNEGQEASEVK